MWATVKSIAAAIAAVFGFASKAAGQAQSAQDRKAGADGAVAASGAEILKRENRGDEDAARIRDIDDADRHFGL